MENGGYELNSYDACFWYSLATTGGAVRLCGACDMVHPYLPRTIYMFDMPMVLLWTWWRFWGYCRVMDV